MSAPTCDKHRQQKVFVDCWNCEDGYSHHDCGEDCCVCADPEPNVRCDICRGKGGYYLCPTCAPDSCEGHY